MVAVSWRQELIRRRAQLEELVGFRPHPFHSADVRPGWPGDGRWGGSRHRQSCAQPEGERAAFGFESVDDDDVARGLSDAAVLPIRDSHVAGPVNPSLNYEIGLLIEGSTPSHHDDVQSAVLCG
jgi:hypothetical protein